jgi:hypothetical protein
MIPSPRLEQVLAMRGGAAPGGPITAGNRRSSACRLALASGFRFRATSGFGSPGRASDVAGGNSPSRRMRAAISATSWKIDTLVAVGTQQAVDAHPARRAASAAEVRSSRPLWE